LRDGNASDCTARLQEALTTYRRLAVRAARSVKETLTQFGQGNLTPAPSRKPKTKDGSGAIVLRRSRRSRERGTYHTAFHHCGSELEANCPRHRLYANSGERSTGLGCRRQDRAFSADRNGHRGKSSSGTALSVSCVAAVRPSVGKHGGILRLVLHSNSAEPAQPISQSRAWLGPGPPCGEACWAARVRPMISVDEGVGDA
jgi:hypothetical protein